MSLKNQLTENVKLLQKAVIIRQNGQVVETLLLKRSLDAKSRPGCWDLPGGNSEWPATEQSSAANLHLQDLQREVAEETGLSIDKNLLTLDKLTHLSTYFAGDQQVYTIICAWLINYPSTDQNEIHLSDEHQEYVWVTEDQLVSYDFGGARGAFILDMIKQAFARY